MMKNIEIALFLREKEEQIARESTEIHYSLKPDLIKKHGTEGKAYSVRDARFIISSLADAIEMESLEMFASHVGWLSVLLSNFNCSMNGLRVFFGILRDTINKSLPDKSSEIVTEYINAGITHILEDTKETSYLQPKNPYYDLASEYLSFLLKGDKNGATSLITRKAEDGLPVRKIYLNVFQPVQYEIGRLWQTNKISVAEEHYATAVTQLAISLLYPYIFSTKKNGYRIISTSINSELHEMGIRMVTDFLESEGWDTWFIGSNSPDESIIKMVGEQKPDVLAVSATLTRHLSKAEQLIRDIRNSQTYDLKIVVGGQAFTYVPGKWKREYSDGYAMNAELALDMINDLMVNRDKKA